MEGVVVGLHIPLVIGFTTAVSLCAVGLAVLSRKHRQVPHVPDLIKEKYANLTPRQIQILKLITEGCSNKEIAYMLGISNETVKNHVAILLRRLNVQSRTQAAIRYGLAEKVATGQDKVAVGHPE